MSYMSLAYYGIVLISLLIYYIFPAKYRWCVILVTSLFLYLNFSSFNRKKVALFLLTALLSYIFGLLLQQMKRSKVNPVITRIALIMSVLIVLLPLAYAKAVGIITPFIGEDRSFSVITAVGISFYTLQIIGYLADVYNQKIRAQRNPAKYLLFVSFFPQIIQGPIPRFKELSHQFFNPEKPGMKDFSRAFELMIWGWFLKMMIADKAGIVVNAIFDHYKYYAGAYYWVAGILYSIQLYADFMACVLISKGTAALYGIKLKDNFDHPYFATSIQDFWRRWHMSLSSWLRDYVYIPLGGQPARQIQKVSQFTAYLSGERDLARRWNSLYILGPSSWHIPDHRNIDRFLPAAPSRRGWNLQEYAGVETLEAFGHLCAGDACMGNFPCKYTDTGASYVPLHVYSL